MQTESGDGMILVVSLTFFLFAFFLGLSVFHITRAQETELRAKIQDRLKNTHFPITEVKLEKKDRLSDLPLFNRILQNISKIKKLEVFIEQSDLSISVGTFILFSLFISALSSFLMLLFGINLMISMVCSFFIFFIPSLFVNVKRLSRIKMFSARFSDSIALIAGSLRAGHSLQMAIGTVVQENKDIVSFEFQRVLSEIEVGQNFEDALKGMLKRIDTPELRLFISAVILQRETGGNLAELLDNLETVIRERQELKRELRAATAQARLSGTVLSLLPVFVGFFIFVINHDYIMFFFDDPFGTKLLFMCIAGQILGILAIRKIVQLDF